jgi:RNA recognition motif. (a.k.a. RRM, RBD, or RNP domain)
VLKSIVGKLGKGVVTDLRLSLDENKRPRGFGYVELKEESMVEGAIADLNGLDVGECCGTLLHTTILCAPSFMCYDILDCLTNSRTLDLHSIIAVYSVLALQGVESFGPTMRTPLGGRRLMGQIPFLRPQ